MPEPTTQLQEALRAVIGPLAVMQRVVDQALDLIEPAEGAMVGLTGDGELTYLCAAGTLVGQVGARPLTPDSLAGAAVATGQTRCCSDAAADERADADALRLAEAAAICVPLVRGGAPIGVLTVSAGAPGAFIPAHVATLGRLGEFISVAIGASSDLARVTRELLAPEGPPKVGRFVANVLRPGLAGDLAARRRIEDVLQAAALTMRCQPIIDVSSGDLVGTEALARFPHSSRPADEWFHEAEQAGLGVRLQLAAVAAAVLLLDALPEDAFLAINVGPDVIVRPELIELLDEVGAERIVLELTEHLRIDDYCDLHESLSTLRKRGARLAVDDTGAGFSSLGHIVHLAPELIKLDRGFTRGIDTDPVRRSLARALVGFAREVGADVVAEGIETATELETVRELGIPYGQGYFIARPMPVGLLTAKFAPGAGARVWSGSAPLRSAHDLP